MKLHHSLRNKSAQGFTLIEIMVVIAIIAVLATMTVTGLGYFKRKAAESKTKIFVASVSQALTDYKSDEGTYPTDASTDGSDASSALLYIALYGDSNNSGKPDDDVEVYLPTLNPSATGPALNVEVTGSDTYLVDGWGNRLRYRSPGNRNPSTEFDLWSMGADGQSSDYPDGSFGSDDDQLNKDDLKNW